MTIIIVHPIEERERRYREQGYSQLISLAYFGTRSKVRGTHSTTEREMLGRELNCRMITKQKCAYKTKQ